MLLRPSIVTIALFELLTFATATARAQSNVTLSGYLDIGIYRSAAKAWNVGPIQRSNIAFSGSEDLGGGLTATFRLSHRFDIDTGTLEDNNRKPFWHGESTVGLKGPFGSVQLGRRLDAMYNNDYQFDPWGYFDRIASPAWDLWHYNFPSDPRADSGGPDFGRLNNGVFYDSPAFGGFALSLSGSPERQTGDPTHARGGAVTFKQGDYAAMLSHERNSADSSDTFVGLKGALSSLTLMGAYDLSRTLVSKAKVWTAGASYALGAATLKAGWGQANVDGVKVEKMIGLGASYSLSKRTSVYADYAHKSFVETKADVYGVGGAPH